MNATPKARLGDRETRRGGDCGCLVAVMACLLPLSGAMSEGFKGTRADSICPKGDSIYPKMDSIYPKGDSIYPKMDSIHPKGDSIYLKMDSIYPKVDSIYPKMDSIYPTVDSIYPKMDSIHPKGDSISPAVHQMLQATVAMHGSSFMSGPAGSPGCRVQPFPWRAGAWRYGTAA